VTIAFALLFFILVPSGSHADEISLKQTSKSGLQGWTLAKYKSGRGEWMNSTLVVTDRTGKVSKFRAEYGFIEQWGFVDNDTAIVIRSVNAHGPSYWQKFDIKSRKLIDDYFYSKSPNRTPSWAKTFYE